MIFPPEIPEMASHLLSPYTPHAHGIERLLQPPATGWRARATVAPATVGIAQLNSAAPELRCDRHPCVPFAA